MITVCRGEEGTVGLDVAALEQMVNEMRRLLDEVCREEQHDEKPDGHLLREE